MGSGRSGPLPTWYSHSGSYREDCGAQGQPLNIAFIHLTKAFDLVSRGDFFQILAKIGCPPTLLSIVKSFHEDMMGTIMYDGCTVEPFDIHSRVRQGCSGFHTIWHLLCCSTEACLWISHKRHLPPHKIQWEPLQALKVQWEPLQALKIQWEPLQAV